MTRSGGLYWWLRRMLRTCCKVVVIPLYVAMVILIATYQDMLTFVQRSAKINSIQPRPVEQDFYEILGESSAVLPVAIPNVTNNFDKQPKLILSLGHIFTQAHLGGCPDLNCKVSFDPSLIDKSDAVIFESGISVQHIRPPWQYHVFFTQESPLHASVEERNPGFYNLTMGYRRDADLPCPYGYVIKRIHPRSDEEMKRLFGPDELSSKNSSVAWFVSNCNPPSRRGTLVEELQRYIDVDIYGSCGSLSCRKDGTSTCSDLLDSRYYFYLAFENSICKDYITEKFWERAALNRIVPVVLKRSIVQPYMPSQSFIAADDFQSVKDMADYLNKLVKDAALYAEYFQWHRDYDAVYLNGRTHDIMERPWGICRLCDLLWKTPRPVKIQEDIGKWWHADAKCDNSLVSSLIKKEYV